NRIVRNRARRARKHERPDAGIRVPRGERSRRPTTHRMRHDAHIIDAQMVEQPYRVGPETPSALLVQVDAPTERAGVVGDTGVVGREEGHLLPPAEVTASLAMRKKDGRAG